MYGLRIRFLVVIGIFCSMISSASSDQASTNTANDGISSATQLALTEDFGNLKDVKVGGVEDFVWRTVGTLRGMRRSYAREYAQIYLHWWYVNRDPYPFKAITSQLPSITEEPGTEQYEAQLTRMQKALQLAFWLSHKMSDLLAYSSFAEVARRTNISWRAGQYNNFVAALEFTAEDYYRFPVHMAEVDSFFKLAMKDEQISSASDDALSEFEYDHNAVLTPPHNFLRTAGKLRCFTSHYSKAYAEIYLHWFDLTQNSDAPFLVISYEPDAANYSEQVNGVQLALELAFWLSQKKGDEIYLTYGEVVRRAISDWRDGRYDGYVPALEATVKELYGIDVKMDQVDTYFAIHAPTE